MSTSTKKQKIARATFILNGCLFLMSGIMLLLEYKFPLGIIQLIAAILNIAVVLKMSNKKVAKNLNYALLTVNIIVCLAIGYDNILAGKSYIQYVWFIAALCSLIALIVSFKIKNKFNK